ncbi:MAG: HEAT repeat domain-containing protein [Planctomycetaceae bacterium]
MFLGRYVRRCLAVLVTLLVTSRPANAWLQSVDDSSQATTATTKSDKFAGRSVGEWEDWFKTLELSSPAARDAASELSQLALDRAVPGGLRRQAALTLGRIRPAVNAAIATFEVLLAETEPCETDDVPRSWALKGIGLLGGPAAELAPRIIEIEQEKESSILDRLLGLEALARIGPAHPQTLAAVVEVLQTGLPTDASLPTELDRQQVDLQFRRVAADLLSLFGSSAATAVPVLLSAAREDDEPLRRAAVTSLGSVRQLVTLEPLTDILLFDQSPAVQDAAAVALSKLGPAAAPRLMNLLDDSDPAIQLRAADALGLMEGQAESAMPRLKRAVGSTYPGVRLAAAEALWRISRRIDPALEAAISQLAANERQDRMRAHRLILRIGRESPEPQQVLMQLSELLDSADPRVRQAALIAIREISN